MKLTEANIVLLFVLLSPHRSNFAKDFSSNVRIHESIFLTSFHSWDVYKGAWSFGYAEKNV